MGMINAVNLDITNNPDDLPALVRLLGQDSGAGHLLRHTIA